MMKTRDCPLELKALDESGSFAGYASIFGNVDDGGDIVERGAFKEFAKTRDGKVRVLYMHSMRDPIGKAEVKEDDRGLYFEGKLALGDATARKAYEFMKAGTLDGMSIGYDILPGGAEITEGGVRRLKGLKLYEISPVTFGMNELARIETVKSIEKVNDIRELEDLLRDAAGLSRAQAKLHAGAIWKTRTGQRDADGEGGELKQTIARLNAHPITLPKG